MSKLRATILLAAALLLASSTVCLAIFPRPDFPPTGFGYVSYRLSLGWYNDMQAWYLTDDGSTNSLYFAQQGAPCFFFSQKLGSALEPRLPGGDIAARPMYIVINPSESQGPIFAAAPGDPLYSGLWQIFYITWKEGVASRPITNANPYPTLKGLPDAAEADIVATDIVIQYPIAAIGVLGGPWQPAPPGGYRMPQAVVNYNYTQTKAICLPTYTVFCSNIVTKHVSRQTVAIPDVGDQDLAEMLGANLAPGLLNVPDADSQAFWSINASPYLCQFPLLEHCPQGAGAGQYNPDWTPIVRLTYLDRIDLPLSTVISSKMFLQLLLGNGHLSLVDDSQRMGILFVNPKIVIPAAAD